MEHKENHGKAHESAPSGPKQLHRSREDRILFGVCGGLAKYFEIDPAIVRISFVVLAFASGLGIIAYLIFSIAVKEDISEKEGNRAENLKEFTAEAGEKAKELAAEAKRMHRDERMSVVGLVLIFLGVMFILDRLLPMSFFRERFLWPGALILIGLILVLKSRS